MQARNTWPGSRRQEGQSVCPMLADLPDVQAFCSRRRARTAINMRVCVPISNLCTKNRAHDFGSFISGTVVLHGAVLYVHTSGIGMFLAF